MTKQPKKYTAKTAKNETPIIVTASNKREAWEKIKQHRPNTKLSDIILH